MKKYLLTRDVGLWSDVVLLACVLTYVLIVIGQTSGVIILGLTGIKHFLKLIVGSDGVAVFMCDYLAFIGIWIIWLLAVLIPKFNRPIFSTLTYRKSGNSLGGAAIGLLLGFLTNGFCILMAALMGDIVLSFNSFQPGVFLLFFLAVTIQSGAEEVLTRSYLYQKLRRGYKQPWIAIIGNGILFSVIHLFNPGINIMAIVNIVLVAIVFSLLVYYYDCLWAAIMMHAGWNFTQNILFGLPNSGIVSEYSVFKLDAASASNGIFYNVNFGVEGCLGANIVLGVLAIALILLNRGKGERRDIWSQA